MTTTDTILVVQTAGIWAAVIVAPATVWAMLKQTRMAAGLALKARRQECLERLLGLYEPKCLQSGPDFYRVLNSIPALFPHDAEVLKQYQHFRDLSVQRDQAQRQRGYAVLMLRIAAACGLPLTEEDLAASFAEQWGPAR
jgi:hypothetical protein